MRKFDWFQSSRDGTWCKNEASTVGAMRNTYWPENHRDMTDAQLVANLGAQVHRQEAIDATDALFARITK